MLGVLLLCNAAFADLVTGSSGGAWRTWVVGDLNENGTPYWDGNSADSNLAYSVGNCLAGVNCIIPGGGPGVIPYWGMGNGAADPSFYLTQSVPTSNAALKIEIAGNANINAFGWYDTTSPGTLNVIFSGAATTGATTFFSPTATYGFWFTGSQGTYFTQSGGLGSDQGNQHFAIFQGSATPGGEVYWLGIEDLNLAGSDRDYNDMIVRVSAVPDGGVTLMLLGSALVGLESLRRRLRA